MHTRSLGETDLLVTPIGLGMAALGRPGYVNLGHAEDLESDYDATAMERRAHVVLDAAWEAGVRYFDAARSYGQAERFLGSWLSSRNPHNVTIGSKWGYTYTAGWQVDAEVHEVKEHSLQVLERQWRESKELLGDSLSLYQIHSATLDSGVLDNQEVLSELARLRAQGIRIGLSLSGAAQVETLRKAVPIALDGVRLFDSVQATWNLLEPSAGPALSEARAAGMGIIIKEALANGRLTDRNTDPAFAAKLEILKRQASQLNTTVDALALAVCLYQPWVDVVLSGAATVSHLLSNLTALQLKLDDEALAGLSTLAEPTEFYWEKRKRMAWN
jgi:aryl-alcohol dehydrogenase-like predicted oxidoreductase